MCKKVVGRTTLGCACCFIVTHYVDGEHNIGMHFDKPKSIRPGSLITVVKTGAHGRPFRLERLDSRARFSWSACCRPAPPSS